MINENLMDQIKNMSLSDLNREVCGFVIDDSKLIACENKSSNPYSSFRISPEDYLMACNLGKITAVYHSHHKDTKFSDFDLTQCRAYGIPFLVFCNKTLSFNYIEPDKIISNPYIGREFQLGKSDCYSLVEDFYLNEFGIILNKFKRDNNWRDTYKNLIDYYKGCDFDTVTDKYQYGDILILDMLNEGIGSHLAIFLSDDSILHHRRDWASNIVFYSNSLRRRTLMIVRHKKLCK